MPHRIISSIISSQLTGGTFLPVLGSSYQLHQGIHKPSLVLHCSPCSHPVPSATHQLLIMFLFCCCCALISSPEVAEHPWAAGAGLSWCALEGPAQVIGSSEVWGSQPGGGSSQSPLCSPCRLPRFMVTSKNWWEQRSGPPSHNLPSPWESHCLVLTTRWTSTSWHFPSSKEKCLIYRTPAPAFWERFPIK